MTARVAGVLLRTVAGSVRRRIVLSAFAVSFTTAATLAAVTVWTKPSPTAALVIAAAALLVAAAGTVIAIDRLVREPIAALRSSFSALAAGDQDVVFARGGAAELTHMASDAVKLQQQFTAYAKSLDASIERLLDVSRALTTTTGGVERLQDAIVATTSALAGAGATAHLFARQQDELVLVRHSGAVRDQVLSTAQMEQLLQGTSVRDDDEFHNVLAVPMLYQGAVVGALLTITLTPVYDSDERTLRALANNAAVALENTRLYEQEKETVARLTQLNQLKSDLLGTMQHELRTPVLAIQGQLELLSIAWERWDDAARLDVIADIGVSTRTLSDLVETIVDFSLLNAETVDLRLEAVDLATTLRDAADDVRGHFKSGLPVELRSDVDRDIRLKADAKRLRQVMRALLDNAAKFTREGGTVSVTARADGQCCRIEVQDDGIGIGASALPHVFEEFFQEDNTRTRKYGGMGMGLALVRCLCRAHGAEVEIASEQGSGTTVSLTWPVADAATARARQPDTFHLMAAGAAAG